MSSGTKTFQQHVVSCSLTSCHRAGLSVYVDTSLTKKLSSWRLVFRQKLIVPQLVKKLPAFCVTWKFITMFTTAHHLSLSWARSIPSIPSHPVSLRSILILYFHLCSGNQNRLFPWVFLPTCIYIIYIYMHVSPILPHATHALVFVPAFEEIFFNKFSLSIIKLY